MFTRHLGKSKIEVSAMGLGCWAIGGPWFFDNGIDEPFPAGWGKVDDNESIRAIHAGLDAGINFFDTAANYGTGHSEEVLAKALAGRRNKVVIATKFGYLVDPVKKTVRKDDPAVINNIRQDCENSLQRLNTDYIDLYQLHVGDFDPEQALSVRDLLEWLVKEGKIRWYGWSTDSAERASVFADGENCTAIQQMINWALNVDYSATLNVCEVNNLASIIRGPLSRGILTGKFQGKQFQMPPDDVRRNWKRDEGRVAEIIEAVDQAKEVLTEGGRTLAQGALGWLWARSESTIPIPGFKTVDQVIENTGAMEFGPLTQDQMEEINKLLDR